MPPKTLKILDVQTGEDWRKWLAKHHDSESEVWLVFRKRQTGQESIAYNDAVDAALCYGWIDSLVKRLDDERYARKFTPRKPESKWSTANRQRYARLQANGMLTPAGLARAPTDRSGDAPWRSLAGLPAYIQQAFQRNVSAWDYFQGLAPSYQRMYVAWIDSAKRPETKTKRLGEAVRLLAAGQKLGLK